MRTDKKAVDNLDKPRTLKATDSSPESTFATTWVLCDSRLFWVDLTIVGPVTEKPQYYRSLGSRKPKSKAEAIADLVKLLNEKLLGEDSPG